jgi:hypothetical protein
MSWRSKHLHRNDVIVRKRSPFDIDHEPGTDDD